MKRNIVMAIVACAFASLAEARVAAYVTPSVRYSKLNDSKATASGQFGYAFAGGCVWGSQKQYDVGGEVGYTKFSGDYTAAPGYTTGEPGGSTTSVPPRVEAASFRVTPVLAGFRYSFRNETDALRPFLGLNAGVTFVNIAHNGMTNSGVSLTFGVKTGAALRLGDHTYLEFEYRYVFSTDANDILYTYNFRYNAHVVSLGLAETF